MKQLKLGKTGLKVSEIGLGGEWFVELEEDKVKTLMNLAIEQGMNYIDIFMPQPKVRSSIGKALLGQREKMYIQGHLCTVYEEDQYTRTRDLNKTKASFEDLLTRLQTNYIDVGMIHYVDSMGDYESLYTNGIVDYVKELKAKGTIHHIGMSSHNAAVAKRAVEEGLIEVLLFSINAAYDLQKADMDVYELIEFKGFTKENWVVDPERQKLYAACEANGVGITVMKALGAGSLLKAETSPFGQAMTVTQCCHYCLTRPGVSSVLIGCQTETDVLEAVKYSVSSEKEKDYSFIFESGHKLEITGRCMYCNHCQPCPSHIDIAAITKYLDLAKMSKNLPATVKEHYLALSSKASDCIECGNCEPNCPFGVSIMENMKQAKEVFGE